LGFTRRECEFLECNNRRDHAGSHDRLFPLRRSSTSSPFLDRLDEVREDVQNDCLRAILDHAWSSEGAGAFIAQHYGAEWLDPTA
jgi:hypothetical protein